MKKQNRRATKQDKHFNERFSRVDDLLSEFIEERNTRRRRKIKGDLTDFIIFLDQHGIQIVSPVHFAVLHYDFIEYSYIPMFIKEAILGGEEVY